MRIKSTQRIFEPRPLTRLQFCATTPPSVFLARVVRKADNEIHQINRYSVDSVLCYVKIIHWKAIYPMVNNYSPKWK